MFDRTRRAALRAVALLALLPAFAAQAQTPQVTPAVPAESFLGEQFCFVSNLFNTGSPGYGPYLRLELPPTLAFNGAEIFDSPVTVISNQVFPGTGLLTDALLLPAGTNNVTGTPGNSLIILQLPVGSITQGGPPLETEICLTIAPGADVGTPLPVGLTPVYQFGATPTGAGGSIVGTPPPQTVTPTVILFEKSNTAPEEERTPGSVWPYDYVLSVNIANTATINPLQISDVLPADVQFVGPVTITGGTGCAVTASPSTTSPGGMVGVTCSGNTVGTTAATDVEVRFPVHIIDTLDETGCGTELQTNNASVNATYVPPTGPVRVLPALSDTSDVTAKHVAVQKSVSPASGDPGTSVTYTLQFQTTQFGTTNALSVLDTLPDGIDFVAHGQLTVGGNVVAITPTVVPGVQDTIAYDIHAANGANIAPGTAITLTYTGVVRQLYERAGTPPVLAADTLTNTVVATYSLVEGANTCTDGSAATFVVDPVDIVKRVLSTGPYSPGDTVRFRLSMNIPSGDTQNVVFRDFFPLPVFDVTTLNLTYNGPDITRAVGGAGADTMNLTPTISIDAATNALILQYPNVNTEAPQTVAVDIEIDVLPNAFADNLFLTNIFRASSANTAEVEANENAPVQILVRSPALHLTKGVSATNGNGVIAPLPTVLPVNGNLTGADAGDSITYRITVENRGGAEAFDVVVTDPAPAGLVGCSVSAALASGTPLTFTGSIDTGITLIAGGNAANPVLAANDGTVGAPYGADTAYVDVSCALAIGVTPNLAITNTAQARWRSQPVSSGGTVFPPVSDTAQVTTATPTIAKVIVATSEAHTGTNNVVIGEIIRYRLVSRVPEGTINDFRIRDNLPAGLLYLDDGTARAAFVSNGAGITGTRGGAVPNVVGNADTAAATPLTYSFPVADVTVACANAAPTDPWSNGQDPCFRFGNLVNADSDNDAEFVVVEFNARVLNVATSQSGTTLNNNANVASGGTSYGTTGNTGVIVREPGITVDKTVAPGTADAGDLVNYTIVLRNNAANASTAFDVSLVDTFDALLVPGVPSFTTSGGAVSGDAAVTMAGQTLTFTASSMAATAVVTINISATVQNGVAPGVAVPNSATATWTSLPGTAGTAVNPTGSAAGAAGTSDGERTGSGGVNDHTHTDGANLNISLVTIAKAVTGSSIGYTGNGRLRPAITDLTIGEEVDYLLTVTLPEGSIPRLLVTDVMPHANGVIEMLGATSITVSAGVTTEFMPSLATAPTDANGGDGINDTLALDFGAVSNPPAPGAARTITIGVRGRVRDVPSTQNTDALDNTATVQFGTGLNGVATASVDIVEPLLDIVKSSTVTTGQAGDVIPYTVTVSHNSASNADAQNLVLQDLLPTPAGLDTLQLGTVNTTGTCAPAPVIDTSATTSTELLIEVTQLPLGCTLNVQYTATLQNDVQVGTDIANTAALAWDSITDGLPEAPNGRSYTNSDGHIVEVSSPGVDKQVTATSAPSTGTAQLDATLDDLAIGEIVTYRFSTVLPAGVSPNAIAVDQLPTGNVSMRVVSSQIVAVGSGITGAPAIGTAGVASDTGDTDTHTDRVTWTLGNLNANPAASDAQRTLLFEVVAQVMDTPQTAGGVTVRNTASFTTDTAGTSEDSADVDIVEPRLQLTKAITNLAAPVIVEAGDAIVYTITLAHRTGPAATASAADAFNIVVTDVLPDPGVAFVALDPASTCAGVTVDTSAAPTITFDVDGLALADASCTIVYSGTVTNTVTPSSNYTNLASAAYDSLPVPVAGATRRGITNTDADVFSIVGPSLVKIVTGTNLDGTAANQHDPALADLAIGETVVYRLTMGFPEGTVNNAVLVDSLPRGAAGVLEAVSGNVVAIGHGGITTTLPGTAVLSDVDGDGRNDTVTFDFGTISNPSNGVSSDDFIEVDVVARVANVPVNADGFVLTNNATFTSATTTPVSDDADVDVVEPDLVIGKTMGPVVDGVVTINVTLQNTGTAPAHDIVIEDVLPGTLWQINSVTPVTVPAGFLLTTSNAPTAADTTVRIATDAAAVLPSGSIPAGTTLTATFTARLASVPPAQNPVPNTAVNTGASSYPGTTNPDDREYDDIDADATLGLPDPVLLKTYTTIDNDGNGAVSPGDTVVFGLLIDNSAGAAALTGITIEDLVPANTTFNAAASDAGWTGCADGAAAGTLCTIVPANVPAGASIGIDFAVDIDTPLPAGVDRVANQALLDAEELIDPIPSDDPLPPGDSDPTEVPIVASPVLTLDKVDDVATGDDIAPGATIRYTLAYENTGNQTATGVELTETVPDNTVYNATASAPNAWTCAPDNAAGSTCTLAIGTLPVATPGSVLFAVDVVDPVPAGITSIYNAALIEDDRNNSDTDDETTPLDGTPGLNIAKSDGGVTTVPGGTVVYTLRYWNDGDQDAAGVVISETVPANSTFAAGASSAGWTCAGTTPGSACTFTVGTLPGQTPAANADEVLFAVTVDNPLAAGVQQIDNTATITDNDGGSDTSSDDTPVTAAPDLTLAKTDGGATATAGGGIVWTLSYDNVGNQNATGVVIGETVPANTTFNAGGSSAGWVCTPNNAAGSTCTLALGAVGVGAAGSVSFAVIVDNPLPAGVETVANTAVIADDGTNGTDPTPENNTASDDTPVDALPVLTVDKDDGGISTTAGGTVAWTLTYRNTGDQAASGVVLRETVPLHATFDAAASAAGWSCADGSPAGTPCSINVGTVAAGAPDASVAFAVRVVDFVPAGVTQLANTVDIVSDGSSGEGTDPHDDATDTTPIDATPDLTLSKTDGGIGSVPGGTIVYTLSVSNVGSQDATGVLITETVPLHTTFVAAQSTTGWSCVPNGNAGSTCSIAIGAIEAGGKPVDVAFAVLVDATVPDGVTEVLNTAVVADDGSNGADPTPGNNTASDDTPTAAGPDLTLAKDDGGITSAAGQTVVYTLTYRNVGTQDATGVTITETVPANTTFDAAASAPGWSCLDSAAAGETCTLSVGDVDAGDPAVGVAFAVRIVDVLPAGVNIVANTAVIADDGNNGTDPTPEDNTASDDTPVGAAPDLSITKTDNDAIATPGGTITWTLAYANTGDQDASGVFLAETVPANTRFSVAASSPGWTCVDGSAAGTVCNLTIGAVAAGDSGSVMFAVTVVDPLPAGVEAVSNTVTIDDDGTGGTDPTPENNTDTDDTPVNAAPDLSVTKVADVAVAVAGGDIAYTLTYANIGDQDATGVVLTETVPAHTTFVAVGSSAGWTCVGGGVAGSSCTLAIGNLAAGAAPATVTFAVTVDEPLPAGVATLLNAVVIADDGDNGIDPDPDNNTGTDETPLTANPDLTLLKTTTATEVEADDEVPYTLTYRNIGARDASGVVITETVPAGTVFVVAGSTAGWSCADGAAAGTTCELEVGDVAAGADPASVVFVVRVIESDEETVENTASIADDGTGGEDPTPENNVGSVGTPIDSGPDPVPEPTVIPASDAWAKMLLLLALFGIGLVAIRQRR